MGGVERIYYDGECGFCRGWARWILRRDRAGAFRFAPLGGTTFAVRAPAEVRTAAAGTFVAETADGRWLLRSEAVIHVLRVLGRRRTAAALAAAPRVLRDGGYRAVAAVRGWFRRPREDACAAADAGERARFDP